ncbi:hypothetical protein A2473_00250 [candidate division WWE3 bacterium RIFOXYC2_FULL_42_13]|uniref:Uncharacterized protein n=2 Tax=Katanobacteria TaxID=422282 RepID=A0A0G1EIM2_UNCKA|nr:MAG: hypothetical protein UV89_C0033G0009 [candidate division WWE3 bacterium GW2011_GWB2_43_22]OGC58209.1 MAG: hypothetical protein A2245_00610 [candidate division WWE3 bacterium RIFOXYA2_FULL_43_12]OGC72141.1 MAG: hypothetical protein A2337_01110 [candidate division WWE3 bacterium RIFOXYB2_FULL_43_9]OGC73218.1 MAG: hypothetical protein A2473_00250 [candidate division WWE3 bacterium RIFOXYC2_FULL_42_13]OGC75577.1 MAG: hypothetical protein A2547_00810 [candidate division WWE3 bacterium RIFOXY
MPDSMIFIIQVINLILREEGPMERTTLVYKVEEKMQLGELNRYIETTLDLLIGTKKILQDDDGKLFLQSK